MPKNATNPDLFDRHAQRLTIRALGDISAVKGNRRPARVQIVEDGGEFPSQTVELVWVPKPFGGRQFDFVCPVTGKRCRTLYRFRHRLGGVFAHRAAFQKACYSIQTLSKTNRIFATKHRTEAAIGKAGLKTAYAGRPTRRFSTLTRRLERAKDAELEAMVRLLGRLR
ncbi:MAG: hypothetical protein ACKN97_06795 [Acidobacteriota bacterium]